MRLNRCREAAVDEVEHAAHDADRDGGDPFRGIMGSDFEKAFVAQAPLGRVGQPDDIADVAVFLASNDSRFLTGEKLVASGGFR